MHPKTNACSRVSSQLGAVSYLHMHMLVEQHGQPGWVASLTPHGGVRRRVRAAELSCRRRGRDLMSEHRH